MSSVASHHERFEPTPESARAVRHSVGLVLASWGCVGLVADAVLAASELASNALLHTRDSFQLAMRRIRHGARIEVIDRRPDLVPVAVPTVGSAVDVTMDGTTGRGLQIVSAVASRWGFNTSSAFKAVWVEVFESVEPVALRATPTAPVIELGYRPKPEVAGDTFSLLSMPVRAAVGSGVHVDDLVRELQLSTAEFITDAERTRLFAVLDASAPARLLGRHAALDAAARGEPRFDMRIHLTNDTLVAFGALNDLLRECTERLGPAAIPLAHEVADFRAWLLAEVAAQSQGRPPTPCPLPD